MTKYYVHNSGDGSAPTAGVWATAYATFQAALTAATVDGDEVIVSDQHLESLAADTTFTVAANISVLFVQHANISVLSKQDGTTYYIGHASTSYSITFAGAFRLYVRGGAFRVGGSAGKGIIFTVTDGAHQEFDECYFRTANYSGGRMVVGYSSGVRNGFLKLKNTELSLTHADQGLSIYNPVVMENVTLTGATQTQLIYAVGNGAGVVQIDDSDISSALALLGSLGSVRMTLQVSGSVLNASVAPLAAQAVANRSGGEVYINNCTKSGVQLMGHYNALGQTESSTTVYANDGLTYDGTNKCSWKISTTANASAGIPYESPWMDQFHSGTSAITPYLEIARDGSATPLLDSQAWGQFSYLGTAGSSRASYATDRMSLLGTPANQAESSKTVEDWTGEGATAWFGKLDSGGAITPAQAGPLRARVCVAAANETLYVDTQIRGTA